MRISRFPGVRRDAASTLSTGPAAQRLLVGATVAALILSVGTASATPAAVTHADPADKGRHSIFIGASGGAAVEKLAHKVHARLAFHAYGQLQGSVPQGRLINMAPNIPWHIITASKPGSKVYRDLVRWANTLKRRHGPILFTFSHEPEGDQSQSEHLGTAPEFIRAFRKVEHLFQARGVRNVEYVWNMTSNSFRVPHSDPRFAARWYPGNKYVDNVASAAYNWYNCGEGTGRWLSLADRAAAPLAFAKKHHKKLVLAEWASQRGPRRARWLRSAHQWFDRQHRHIRAAFYYQTSTPRDGCNWKLAETKEFKAFGYLARDFS